MIEINNKTRSAINVGLIKKTAENFLTIYKKNNVKDTECPIGHSVSIAFVGDKIMRKLNKIYYKTSATTDVFAFSNLDAKDTEYPIGHLASSFFLGEIIINYAQVKKQSNKFNHSINQELCFVLIHGLLHLLGYDDDTEKSRIEMEKLGYEFINSKKLNKRNKIQETNKSQ